MMPQKQSCKEISDFCFVYQISFHDPRLASYDISCLSISFGSLARKIWDCCCRAYCNISENHFFLVTLQFWFLSLRNLLCLLLNKAVEAFIVTWCCCTWRSCCLTSSGDLFEFIILFELSESLLNHRSMPTWGMCCDSLLLLLKLLWMRGLIILNFKLRLTMRSSLSSRTLEDQAVSCLLKRMKMARWFWVELLLHIMGFTLLRSSAYDSNSLLIIAFTCIALIDRLSKMMQLSLSFRGSGRCNPLNNRRGKMMFPSLILLQSRVIQENSLIVWITTCWTRGELMGLP